MHVTKWITLSLIFFANRFVSPNKTIGIDVEKRVSNMSNIMQNSSNGAEGLGELTTNGTSLFYEGTANYMSHIKMPFAWNTDGLKHEALEFDVVYDDGNCTKYTVDCNIYGEVQRRFCGDEKRTEEKSTSIRLCIKEINDILYTNYELLYTNGTYDCQKYVQEMYWKIYSEWNLKINLSKVLWKTKQAPRKCCEKCIIPTVNESIVVIDTCIDVIKTDAHKINATQTTQSTFENSSAMQYSDLFVIIFCVRSIICLQYF